MLYATRILGAFLLLVTLLPLISTGKWFVRWWDFPRLQIACLLLIALFFAGSVYLQKHSTTRPESIAWLVLLTATLLWQGSHIIQFMPLWPKEVPIAKDSDSPFTLMVANLDKDNPDRAPVTDQIRAEQAEVLLLIEYDQAWAQELADLRTEFRYHHEAIKSDGLGIALWSTIPMVEAQTRFTISERRPSIWARLQLQSGASFNLVGLHPTPPGLLDATGGQRRDSRVRDAELILTAKEIAKRNDESWCVAGDFNDVAWSHTTRLFKRISGVKDPRFGRSFMGTYIAQYPPLRCPIDHVFLSNGFSVAELSRATIGGSDHFAVIARIALENSQSGTDPEPQGNDQKDAQQIIKQGEQDAQDRDIASPPTGI
jgi:endonuclease/exonuclease/phosphatase (EEP) superfamily protein YafD